MEIGKPSEAEFEQVIQLANSMKLDVTDASREQFIIVKDSNYVAAFARIFPKGTLYELATLGVVKTYRGQGLSMLLVEKLRELYPQLYLVTVIPEYFKKLGFEVSNEIPKELESKYNQCELWHGYGDPVVMKCEA
ncbi:GNAT family N-acetyltransferase [bacterium SCSIO 12643]|nr:GNAT family N-acetyltransferase [bacterium SCSIO 12643]